MSDAPAPTSVDFRRRIKNRAARLIRLVDLSAPWNILVNEAFLVFRAGCDIRKMEGEPQEGTDPSRGINGCITWAAKALEHLGENERPTGGESFFNSIHCHQLADELRRTLQPRAVLEEDIAVELWQAESIRATGKPRRDLWDDVGDSKVRENYLFLARHLIDNTFLKEIVRG